MIANEILAVRPDWSSAVGLEYLWKTVIKQAVTGAEKRSSLWSVPHRTFEFQCEARNGMEASMLRQRLQGSLGLIYGVPLWSDAVALSAGCDAGDRTLPVTDTVNRLFPADGLAIIVSGAAYEVLPLDSVGANSLTLAADLPQDWPAGSFVCPFFQGRMDKNQITLSGETGESAGLTIRLVEELEERLPDLAPDLSACPQYLGLYLLSTPHNFSSKVSTGLATSIDVHTSLGGCSTRLYTQDEPGLTMALTATLFSREDIRSFLDFFIRHRGRLSPFWFPSPHADILLSRDYEAGAMTFSVQGTDSAIFFAKGFHAEGKYVLFRFPDGSIEPRKVTAWSSDGYSMTVDVPIVSVWPYRTVTVSFLHLARFGKDVMGFDFSTTELAETRTEIATIPCMEIL